MKNKLMLLVAGLTTGFMATGFANGSDVIDSYILTEVYNTSSTTMTNNDFDNTLWEYSNFGKNGSNVAEISINACLDDYWDYEPFQPINLKVVNSDYSTNEMSSETLHFTKQECKQVLKEKVKNDMLNLVFDRRISNGMYAGSTLFIASAYPNYVDYFFTLEFKFKTQFEFNVESILYRGVSYVSSPKNITFSLYNENNKVMTKIVNTKVVNTISTEKISLPKRLQEVWGVGISIPFDVNYDDMESIYAIQEFNSFSKEKFFKPSFTGGNDTGDLVLPIPEYDSCSWNDFMCHLSNFGVWLVKDFPPIQILYTGFNYVLTMFTGLFGMIVSMFGITISTGNVITSKYVGFMGYFMLLGFAIGMWKLIKFVRGLIT